ncbi:FAD-dependent oxidoreductase [Nocardiopsis sp. HNM0947]|uniref:FAD-dependent oxidoreductase n=1 Tax=Nocardiopsis coralli TaxID=2772213 RepID=A0ABR9PBT2_9ACTN|nr:FAD-dependent oxidoreductase [Nocardiopsis coralli]MBE3001300.1 FAD-dependent oxidoreductase [Nocardiopsis coralli]
MSTATNTDTTCVIVGGGPAGMIAGLLLARAGVEVTVLEKHADFLRDFRGDTVHPSTLRLLDELGLGPRFESLPQSRLDRVSFPINDGTDSGSDDGTDGGTDGDSVTIADFSYLRVPHPYIAMVPQWDLLDLIADAAREEPTFTLRMNTRAIGLLHEDGRVVGVEHTGPDGPGRIRADLTLACDGRGSLLRNLSGLRRKEFPAEIDAWWFRLPGTAPQNTALTPRAGAGRFMVVFPREGYLQIAYIGPKGTDAELRERGIAAFREDIAELAPEFADRTESLRSMDEVKHLDVRVDRLRPWHTDGLLCIGDAAHAMSPVGGVGINLAVQDAVAAATLLAAPLRRGSPSPEQLARVRRRRLPPTVVVQALQRLIHRNVVTPILEGRRAGPPKPIIAALRRFPGLTRFPAYLIGIGLRPEHAPAFARRAPQNPQDPRGPRPVSGSSGPSGSPDDPGSADPAHP